MIYIFLVFLAYKKEHKNSYIDSIIDTEQEYIYIYLYVIYSIIASSAFFINFLWYFF